jgi:hypothetical protein
VSTYTPSEGASRLYRVASNVFNWNKTSDCVTPLELAKQQLENIENSGRICIPGAGIGTYVVAALESGFDPKRITAVEFDPAYYEMGNAIYRRFGVNYVLTDFLTWEPKVEFDVIVGNPPYQRAREVRNVGAPLWPDFIEKSISLLRPEGIVSLVVPFTWMQKNTRGKAWKCISQNDLVRLDPNVDWAFPAVDAGGITVITLSKRPYSGATLLPDGSTVDITEPTPSNNREWTADSFEFLRSQKKLILDVKVGPVKPSINSEHWSPEKTETHCYEVFYSSAKKRRSMWCDQPIGGHGELKLAVPVYGDMYGTAKITTVGCGRQVEYVLGTQEELEEIKRKLETDESRRMNRLNAYGAYHSPLTNIVR